MQKKAKQNRSHKPPSEMHLIIISSWISLQFLLQFIPKSAQKTTKKITKSVQRFLSTTISIVELFTWALRTGNSNNNNNSKTINKCVSNGQASSAFLLLPLSASPWFRLLSGNAIQKRLVLLSSNCSFNASSVTASIYKIQMYLQLAKRSSPSSSSSSSSSSIHIISASACDCDCVSGIPCHLFNCPDVDSVVPATYACSDGGEACHKCWWA